MDFLVYRLRIGIILFSLYAVEFAPRDHLVLKLYYSDLDQFLRFFWLVDPDLLKPFGKRFP